MASSSSSSADRTNTPPRSARPSHLHLVLTGSELRLLRTEAGLSRVALASVIRYSTHTVQSWELGRRRIPDAQVGAIHDALEAAVTERATWRARTVTALSRYA